MKLSRLNLEIKLKENIELVKRSHELATIVRETPVTLDFDQVLPARPL